MNAKEIMITDVKSISPGAVAKDALEILHNARLNSLPVIDKRGKPVGMFTEKNILSYMLPSYLARVGKFVYEENPKVLKTKFAELSQVKVKQLMQKEVNTVTEETSLWEMAKLMMTREHTPRVLIVVSQEGKMIGIVTRSDLLRALAKIAEVS
ncbi:MAG: CBS domain-containing protein [Candidatus Omnitrophica bacterium]|nr:CBS domain-containing protein [Candidatus Omnitrophota bacterium]